MGRILSIVLLVVIVGYVLAFFTTHKEILAVVSSTQGVSVLDAANAVSGDFNETGTLVFYPNNIGPVPYIFYQNQSGQTVAKALIFSSAPPVNFSSWTGARIFVAGQINSEHVVVSTITYISAP